ncbi:DNA-binding Lrp family transcriptional regulator [Haloarcula quadrata]|jgi:DNA-binding Lrp family transcriptional regulator|uniref:Leucine responsive regulatory protein n=4 Tax=Haloarcula TaxID=2237 RepID=Q5V2Q8_HALMA|nr:MULTISPECIES: Lrp/AsnC family transcriptional regulator [Haloarcula]AAV46194.1 leucine responsive regulatory protein [Haloarcula marismortui ATCC 43049]EMA17235.1 leucine responsive regulatory protein [Haloarcula sinaiiensis ATCC 33800]EMA19322.1 leucine responsive regulatory protein [Haloarcula californiae ATCC 33799]NHN65812.1 Lrp/AsnC family transcriptional regulator [Haloarcula sp. JP-Z28]NHX41168.1 Lrp/AsnC family transcriptional regulator [Haloarcula sp. R1-2]
MSSRREILDLLRENARYTTEDIARLTDYSESEVAEIIDEFEEAGIIRGYQAVVDWNAVENDEERVRATVELNVTLDRETSYDDISDRIAKFPEVTSLRLVSGDYDFDLEVEGDSMREVSHFISDKIAPIPEITQTVTHYIMESYKEQGMEFDDHDDDDRLSVSP